MDGRGVCLPTWRGVGGVGEKKEGKERKRKKERFKKIII